jgi:hypothetical protein
VSGSGSGHIPPNEAGTESRQAQTAKVGGVYGDPRLSTSVMADANEGSRGKRRPWLWALGWVGAIVVVIAGLILILR